MYYLQGGLFLSVLNLFSLQKNEQKQKKKFYTLVPYQDYDCYKIFGYSLLSCADLSVYLFCFVLLMFQICCFVFYILCMEVVLLLNHWLGIHFLPVQALLDILQFCLFWHQQKYCTAKEVEIFRSWLRTNWLQTTEDIFV